MEILVFASQELVNILKKIKERLVVKMDTMANAPIMELVIYVQIFHAIYHQLNVIMRQGLVILIIKFVLTHFLLLGHHAQMVNVIILEFVIHVMEFCVHQEIQKRVNVMITLGLVQMESVVTQKEMMVLYAALVIVIMEDVVTIIKNHVDLLFC